MFVSATNPVADPTQAYQGALLSQQLAKSYTTLLTDDHVLRALINQLNLPYSVSTLKGEITASNPSDTAVIDLTVNDRSSQRALAIANAYGPAFTGFVATLETPGTSGTPATANPSARTVGTLGSAELLSQRVPSKALGGAALGAGVGLVLGVCWAVVREMSDGRLRDAQDAARASDAAVLALLPGEVAGVGTSHLSNGQRRLSTVEAYRRLGVNIQLLKPEPGPLAFVVTAPSGGEGTMRTAVDLAITYAEGGDTVILVDANLNGAGPAGLLGLLPGPGLRDVLADRVPLDQALQEWRKGLPLRVLTNGPSVSGPREMLREQRVAALREELVHRANIVIFVAPPLLLKTDAVILARAVGRVLIVARAMSTRSQELAEAAGYLRTVGAAILGVVLNEAAGRRSRRRKGAAKPERDQSDQSADSTLVEALTVFTTQGSSSQGRAKG